ncbi:hypothetical protein MKW98_007936 [Papaver atlanticum]|uniref:Uncharacterized protein n=1 Tax=Papaver atlanticum TaxID=357466 RepID=A0AAD4SK37_9MAGN|nr:hypothetical protein MKW98_007936 [Papaver atlanticum]
MVVGTTNRNLTVYNLNKPQEEFKRIYWLRFSWFLLVFFSVHFGRQGSTRKALIFCCLEPRLSDLQKTLSQLNIGHIDDTGTYTGHFSTFALSGFVRAQVPTHFF